MALDRRMTLIALAGGATTLIACRAMSADPVSRDRVRSDLYDCEGCEAVAERAPATLSTVAQLAGKDEPGVPMKLTGRVTTPDGQPAPGVIIYAHHTNAAGLYADGADESVWSRRHGRLRGWAKTGPDGLYTFNTIKPEVYPDRSMPAHVHLFVGEPGKRPYYIDDVVFAGEFGVTEAYLRNQEFRGGSGVVVPVYTHGGTVLAKRDIRLERHPA